MQHGAGFLQYLDSKTMATHIIASALPPKKSLDYSRYRIVKPAWVVDSIQAGKLLPWTDYRVTDEGARQKVLAFDQSGGLSSLATPKSKRGYREQTDNSFYTSQFTGSASATPAVTTPSRTTSAPPTVEQRPSAKKPLTEIEDSEDDIDDAILDSVLPPDADETQSDAKLPGSSELATSPEADSNVTPNLDKMTDLERRAKGKKPEHMTPEEHNAWLLSDPRIRKSSTANPDFLKQFYSESRLHHLSTWKAELKSRMQRLAKEKEPSAKVAKRKPGARRYVLHVDFDSFFCAVSLKKHPEYAGKPAVVAHSAGAGSEIASCNYPAREFGVKNGMWMKRAQELCPELKVLPYDFPGYEEASRHFYEAILAVGGVVQSVSVDEALLDATGVVYDAVGSTGTGVDEGSVWREQAAADEIARNLRNRIKEKTGCAVSVGIGGNILQAKVALRRAKPAGQFQLKPEAVLDVLGELEVRDLPGVAHSISGKLEEIGVKFVRDIRQVSKEKLLSTLGPKTGEKLWEYARGIDRSEVGEQPPRKSVSAEVNWGIRFINQAEAEEFIMNLAKELERRLVNEQVKGKQLTMKIMRRSLDAPLDPAKHLGHGKCDTFNKSAVFGIATNSAETIGKEAVSILRSFRFRPGDLRGLGLQLTKLEPVKAGSSSSAVEGSQTRLAFPAFSGSSLTRQKSRSDDPIEEVGEATAAVGSRSSSKRARSDPIEEDSESPSRKRKTSTPAREVAQDPIADDPLTPRRPRQAAVHPALAIARAGENDARATTPLNITGTQFILPSQVDPTVLAELPSDIRARLQGQPQARSPAAAARQESPNFSRSRSDSPAVVPQDELVLPSQVDPEVFHALPDDMKAEVLASYGRKPAGPSSNGLHLPQPPQSPRRDRQVQSRKPTTPTRRGGGVRGMWSKLRERQQDAAARRTQTSLAPTRQHGQNQQQQGGDGSGPAATDEELDPDILAELPEDVRREVLDDHRRRRLAQRAGLNFQPAAGRRRRRPALEDERRRMQTRLQFPAPPRKISFMGTGSMGEVKDMLEAWHGQTREDGPHKADVRMFEEYLGRVVVEERDMNKAVKLVQWLEFLVGADASDGVGKRVWMEAVGEVKDEVQKAVREKGLGPVHF